MAFKELSTDSFTYFGIKFNEPMWSRSVPSYARLRLVLLTPFAVGTVQRVLKEPLINSLSL